MTDTPHSSQKAINGLRAGINGFVPHPNARMMHEDLDSLVEQFEALQTVVAQQLTPLDVAITHIEIIRRKGDEYTESERDNVAAIVENHAKEARATLFSALSNPATEPKS